MSTAKPEWMRCLEKQRQLAKKGREFLYQRIKLLVKIADSPEFVAYCEGREERPMTFIDKEIGDTFTNFTILRHILVKYPDPEHWSGGDLQEMRRATEDALRAEARANMERRKAERVLTPNSPDNGLPTADTRAGTGFAARLS